MVVYLLKNRSDDADLGRKDPYEEHIKDVTFIPNLTYVHTDTEKLADLLGQKDYIQQLDGFVVTSQRAVDSLKVSLSQLDPETNKVCLAKPVYTVGPTTAGRLKLIGFTTVHGEDSGNGVALAKYMQASLDPSQKLLFLAGEIHRDHLPKSLVSAGHSVETRIVYKTLPREDVLETIKTKTAHDDWLIFFSPSHIDDVMDYLKTQEATTDKKLNIGAIGPTTEKYLQDNGLVVDAVAEKPTAESLSIALFP